MDSYRLIGFIVLCLASTGLLAQQCDPSRPLSTSLDNFFINDDGTLTELQSGLTWMRCSLGQTWDGKHCTGNARRFTFKQAMSEAIKHLGAGWRVPSIAELATIVERQCSDPRINLDLFPDTPSGLYWTVSKKRGKDDKVYAMDFAHKGVKVSGKEQSYYLRLVSGREPE